MSKSPHSTAGARAAISEIQTLRALRDLEGPVNDLRLMAAIAGWLVDAEISERDGSGRVSLTDTTADLITFAIFDTDRRAQALLANFNAAVTGVSPVDGADAPCADGVRG